MAESPFVPEPRPPGSGALCPEESLAHMDRPSSTPHIDGTFCNAFAKAIALVPYRFEGP